MDAARVLTANFLDSLSPLVASLRGHATHRGVVEGHLFANPQGYKTPARFNISTRILRRQRSLTRTEADHVRTVAPLTAVNPYIVAAGAAAREITNVYLDAEFARRDTETRQVKPSGSYTRLSVVGMGPHGIISSGEILRKRPDLAMQATFIDRAGPGGVFGAANGSAHNLNSANYKGNEPFRLPDVTDGTLRQYAGLFPQYPGERTNRNSGRTGSINRIIPWAPAPDEIHKGARYLDNWELVTMLKEQAALTMRKVLLGLDLQTIELNQDGGPGKFKQTFRDLDNDGAEYIQYTDAALLPTGLSEARRVAEGSPLFQDILDLQKGKPGLPYYTTTLEAYNFFADDTRSPEKLQHGRRFALIGSGDGSATLSEDLAGLFQTANLTDVDKVYIIAEDTVSNRCRYALIADLLERSGRKNILEYVPSRVGGIEFYNRFAPRRKDRPIDGLVLTNENGVLISDSAGRFVNVDHVIESTGFVSKLDTILAPLLNGQSLSDSLRDITAPGKPGVRLGQRLAAYPEIALFGTAINGGFNNTKTAEYPLTTQDVLAAVGENKVSLGLLGPDTTAGTGIWLNRYAPRRRSMSVPERAKVLSRTPATSTSVVVDMPKKLPAIRHRMPIDDGLLTPLLLAGLSQHRLDTPRLEINSTVPTVDDVAVSAIVRQAHVTYDATIRLKNGKVEINVSEGVPAAVLAELAAAAASKYFVAYGKEATRRRRSSSGQIAVQLVYQNGRLKLNKSYAQAV